jgi:two-component sensor histidine kinase
MALHELASNAMRHGALSGSDGTVEVTWSVITHNGIRNLHLEWCEHGGPPVRQPQHTGFGTRLFARVLPQQCNGSVQTHYAPDGFRFTLVAPLIEHRLVPAY